MTDFAGAKIEVYFGPTELKAPDDLETVVCEFIAGAKRSLDIAVQEIDSMKIAEAILDARWRGVQVQIFLEQDYLDPKRGSPKRGRELGWPGGRGKQARRR